MQRFRKAIKRMAAISAGVAMLGATMAGAVAQDLAGYPQPFISKEGVFNDATTIVVGANAAASDTLGAVNIATKLQFEAKTPVTSGGGGLQVSGGVTEDIPLGKIIAASTSYGFDSRLDDSDLESFQDTQINFQGKDYDVHDELILANSTISVETSLTSSDDDYESNVFLEAESKGIRYFYVFDDAINVSKSTSSDPLEVKFLGKTLKITSVGSATKFTAYVGGEYFMDVGDTVTVIGKKVTLQNVGEGGSILVDVDGTRETISSGSTRTVNGIEISNDDTFYTNEISERSASLIIGEDSQATYQDGDAYIGEDENDPDWEWQVANLRSDAATTINSTQAEFTSQAPAGPTLSIYNAFNKNDDTDNPPGLGECLDLPNEYVSICLDSLTVADDDYLEVSIKYSSGVDTAKSGAPGTLTSAKVIEITAPGNDRFIIKTAQFASTNSTNSPSDAKTNQIFIQSTHTDRDVMLFYKDPNKNPSLVYAGNLSNMTRGAETFAQINFGGTKENNVLLQWYNLTTTMKQIFINSTGDSTSELSSGEDVIIANFSTSSNVFNGLGSSGSQEEAGELVWNTRLPSSGVNTGIDVSQDIGSKDEDHRTTYGNIIKDPKSNGASDQVVVLIPGDQVQANVVIKGPTTKVSGGAVSYIPADISINTRLDTEIAGSEANYDLILVGGPCANNAVAAAGLMTCESARGQLAPGEAIIKMAKNGEHVALLVAGYEATETRMAAKVLAGYEDYAGKLTGGEVKVTGTINQPVVSAMAA
ncbi:S-layer protein [Candidatus Woesearchaeota archaeon]|nr:S-layer protein [Candidatus Woesearchaeota archaeon]